MKTAMQDLREDLIKTINTSNKTLENIKNKEIRAACQDAVSITLNTIISRIDDELIQLEKEQIIKAYCSIQGFENLLKEDAEKYYNETFTKNP